MSGENELKPESGFICDECHYARKLRPKSPPDSKGATWFCHCCGHWNIGSIVPIKRDRSGHPTPIQSAPNDEPKSKVVKCPTCATDLIMSEEDAKEMMSSATPPGTEVVPEGTTDLESLIKEAYQICVVKGMALSLILGGHQNANKEAFTFSEQKKDWGLVSNRLRSALDILTRHRATKETPNA